MTKAKIGITERGDAGIDLSWENKLDTVDGAIILTKCLTGPKFQEVMLRHKEKLILHAGISGNGGTIYEPNVLPYGKSLDALQNLIDKGFPTSHIVLRCDPIIPNCDGLTNMKNMFEEFLNRNMNITRIRISVLDNYPHVRERFAEHGIDVLYNGYFQATANQFANIARIISDIFANHDEINIECCAEPKLQEASCNLNLKPIEWCGCCGFKDAEILGITLPTVCRVNPQNRKGCLCIDVKTELLTNPKPCPHKCIYCYWKG